MGSEAGEEAGEGKGPVWREWQPLHAILDQLPHRFQRGLSSSDLQLTCLAALPHHLALGTNVGLVYLAHLPTANLMRLKCEDAGTGLSCVAGVQTVDNMLAAGAFNGTITIFQLPRPSHHPHGTGGGGGWGAPVKRFTVGGVHRGRITCLTWSRNGMRLFCGDAMGAVSLVEVNYTISECTARPLLQEPTTVVQLAYITGHLAVSTLAHTLVCSLDESVTPTPTVVQVGQKPRKQPGPFGCVWGADSLLYCSRPGLRLWSAEKGGQVLHTHIIQEMPERAHASLLNPAPERPREGEHFSFGQLHLVGPTHLVSHNTHWLFIVDVQSLKMLCFSGQFRYITGVAVWEQNVFVLEGTRTISCLSVDPLQLGKGKIPLPGVTQHSLLSLGSRIVTRGSDLMGHIARVSSSVAAKVSEHATAPIVTGEELGTAHGAPSSPASSRTIPSDQQGAGHEGLGHRRSSSSGVPAAAYAGWEDPRMVQSFSSFIPSLLLPSSLVHPLGKTPPMCDMPVSGGQAVVVDLEEVVTSSQIVAQDGLEDEQLVWREKPRRKKGRKPDALSSPDSLSLSSYRSTSDTSDTHLTDSPPSPSNTCPPTACDSSKMFPMESSYSEGEGEVEGATPDTSNMIVASSSPDLPFDSVDTKTYSDFMPSIEKKESLLAEILDLSDLKKDHGTRKTEGESEELYEGEGSFVRELSHESESCSTPSTIKELSPAPETFHDFYPPFMRRQSSIDSTADCRSQADACSLDQEEELHGEGEEQREHAASSCSDDRVSCLSYGPPSGSSLLSLGPRTALLDAPGHQDVSAEFLGVTEVGWTLYNDEYEGTEEKMAGEWTRSSLPGQITSLAVSRTLLAFVDGHQGMYFRTISGGGSQGWRKVQLTARCSQVSLSPSGSVLWLLAGDTAFSLAAPNMEALPAARLSPVARSVGQMSVMNEEFTWFVNRQNQVCMQASVREKGLCVVHCQDHQFVQVSTHTRVVWALTTTGRLMFRIGISSQTPQGHEWGEMEGPGGELVGVGLGPDHRGWVVDAQGHLFFKPGVRQEFPQGHDGRWWQVVSSDYMLEYGGERAGHVVLAPSTRALYLAQLGTDHYFFHPTHFTGHHWAVYNKEGWSTVCAEGLYEDQGALCCLSSKGIFLLNPNTGSVLPFEPPNDDCVVSVSQRPEAMWVLTSAGEVFVRMGLSSSSLLGSHWHHLDLNQIGDIHLCHISCGMEVVWGVDTRGGVYMRQGPLSPSPAHSLPPAWIQVDRVALKQDAVFTKVFVGMWPHMVWAVDSCRRVYVREAIFPELPIGLNWVPVDGLLVLHLSISESAVFALTPSGEVFTRLGVTETNYIGDAWQKIPGKMAKISVTTDNRLWGLNDDGHLLQHETLHTSDTPSLPRHRTHTVSVSSETSEWELVG